MDKPWIKSGQYEIRAILRNALKSQSPLSVQTHQGRVISRIYKLDMTSFSIPADPVFQENNGAYPIIIHDPLAKYEFQTQSIRSYHPDNAPFINLLIPPSISLSQRRLHQRFRLSSPLCAWCSGRFNDGYPFRLKVSDISADGCALILEDSARVPALKGNLLRYVELDFGSLGKLTVHLVVLAVNRQMPLEDLHGSTVNYHLSCQFRQMNAVIRQQLDDLVMRLLVENKRLNRL